MEYETFSLYMENDLWIHMIYRSIFLNKKLGMKTKLHYHNLNFQNLHAFVFNFSSIEICVMNMLNSKINFSGIK